MASPKGRRRGKSARPRHKPVDGTFYAAVDLGTNNCRLLIAEPQGATFRIVDSHSQIARLGEGLATSGRLSDAAIERALNVLMRIREKLRARRVGHVRCIATEACRQAENGAEFIARVRAETGLTFRIIAPKEEARLAMIGCHDLIDPLAKRVLVLDVGGGSTELSLADAERAAAVPSLAALVQDTPLIDWASFPLGVVTLSEAFAHLSDAAAYPAMREHARAVLSGWTACERVREALAGENAHIIGTSGTVTCLAGVHLDLPRYRRDAVDGLWLDQASAQAAIARLCSLDEAGRARLPTIGPERAALMLSGCAIIQAAWDVFAPQRLRVADRGLREGLLLSMMHGPSRSRRRRRPRGGRAVGGNSPGTDAKEAGHGR